SQVDKKWLGAVRLDELDRLTKKDIGTVALELFGTTVVKVRIVEIGVASVVRNLPDAAATMHKNFLKATILWSKGVVVSQVPLAKDGSRVAVVGKYLRHHALLCPRHVTAHDGVPDAGARRGTPSHQGGARGRAGRIN